MKVFGIFCLLLGTISAYPEDSNRPHGVKPLYYYQQITSLLGPILGGDDSNGSLQSMLGAIGKLGQRASSWYDILIEHSDSHKFVDDPDSMLGNVVEGVKEKIQQCYADESNGEALRSQVSENNLDFSDPVAREFMVIVNGVNQLKELLQKEGYIRDINQMKYMKPVNIQNGGREFWIFKLLESKAFLRIICGMMNVEWDILVSALMSQL
ncbi:uncharacterized protein [Atheta coriaria]|uniref:uncharacterized protein n=1 Tax=Dalotia coriaria TaxID=877792 RepID=UPI0031F34235